MRGMLQGILLIGLLSSFTVLAAEMRRDFPQKEEFRIPADKVVNVMKGDKYICYEVDEEYAKTLKKEHPISQKVMGDH